MMEGIPVTRIGKEAYSILPQPLLPGTGGCGDELDRHERISAWNATLPLDEPPPQG